MVRCYLKNRKNFSFTIQQLKNTLKIECLKLVELDQDYLKVIAKPKALVKISPYPIILHINFKLIKCDANF